MTHAQTFCDFGASKISTKNFPHSNKLPLNIVHIRLATGEHFETKNCPDIVHPVSIIRLTYMLHPVSFIRLTYMTQRLIKFYLCAKEILSQELLFKKKDLVARQLFLFILSETVS